MVRIKSSSCHLAARILVVCLLAQPLFGATKRPWRKAWLASVAAVVTVNVLDARSSAGRLEANPILQDAQGRFSPRRAVEVKAAAAGGMLLVQYLVERRIPERRMDKPMAVVNFAAAAGMGAAVYWNTRTR